MDKLGEVFFIAGEIIILMEDWMKRRDKKRTVLRFKKDDKVRLLKLRTWSLRYHVSITEILDMIVPPLLEQVRYKSYGFGMPIRVLTGKSARRILSYQIDKRYPGQENLLVWKEAEREKQLRDEKLEELEGIPLKAKVHAALVDADSVEDYMDKYTDQIMQKREMERKAVSQKWRRRKRYRGNPWL